MTHTLHPEIEEAVDKLVSEITKLKPGYYNADCLLDLERMILKCVGKYLSLPKPTPHIEKMKIQKLGGEVTPLKEEIESLKKSLKGCVGYKDLYERLMPLINELVKDGVIHDNSGDCGEMTEYGPQGERWIKYGYKGVEYDIDSGSL